MTVIIALALAASGPLMVLFHHAGRLRRRLVTLEASAAERKEFQLSEQKRWEDADSARKSEVASLRDALAKQEKEITDRIRRLEEGRIPRAIHG